MNTNLIKRTVINTIITNETFREMVKHFKQKTTPCRYLDMNDIIMEVKILIFEEVKKRFNDIPENEMNSIIIQSFEYIKKADLIPLIKVLEFREETVIAKVINDEKFCNALKKYKENPKTCFKTQVYIALNNAVKEKTNQILKEIHEKYPFTETYNLSFNAYNFVMHKCFKFLCKESQDYLESIDMI